MPYIKYEVDAEDSSILTYVKNKSNLRIKITDEKKVKFDIIFEPKAFVCIDADCHWRNITLPNAETYAQLQPSYKSAITRELRSVINEYLRQKKAETEAAYYYITRGFNHGANIERKKCFVDAAGTVYEVFNDGSIDSVYHGRALAKATPEFDKLVSQYIADKEEISVEIKRLQSLLDTKYNSLISALTKQSEKAENENENK